MNFRDYITEARSHSGEDRDFEPKKPIYNELLNFSKKNLDLVGRFDKDFNYKKVKPLLSSDDLKGGFSVIHGAKFGKYILVFTSNDNIDTQFVGIYDKSTYEFDKVWRGSKINVKDIIKEVNSFK